MLTSNSITFIIVAVVLRARAIVCTVPDNSSSVPSRLLEMLHFLKLFYTNSREIWSHASFIQEHSRLRSGLFIFLVGVYWWFPPAIHSIYFYCIEKLNGQFIQTSKGCSMDVSTPGFTTRSVFPFFKRVLTPSVICLRKPSNTSVLFKFHSAPEHHCQTRFTQSTTSDWSIYPAPWACTMTPLTSTLLYHNKENLERYKPNKNGRGDRATLT